MDTAAKKCGARWNSSVKLYQCFSIIFATTLAGCAAYGPREVAEPSHIKLEDAFASTAAGLRNFASALEAPPPLTLGVYVCKITVAFNISATADQGGSVKATLASSSATTVNGSISAEQDNTSNATRGNTVTIELDGDKSRCPVAAAPAAASAPKITTTGANAAGKKKSSNASAATSSAAKPHKSMAVEQTSLLQFIADACPPHEFMVPDGKTSSGSCQPAPPCPHEFKVPVDGSPSSSDSCDKTQPPPHQFIVPAPDTTVKEPNSK